MSDLGFSGVGKIGHPMCKQFLDAGHSVTAFDLDAAALARMVEAGAKGASSSAEVGAASEVVFTCLPSPASVVDAVAGPGGILEGARAGTIVVDLSTNAPETIRELAARAGENHVALLDAPVAGGVPKAIEGTLTLMVGGEAEDFALVEPLLRCLGTQIFHLGRHGAGCAAKLANNLMATCNMCAAIEVFMMMKRWGIPPERFLETVEAGSGQSASLERFRRKILYGDFSAEFTVDMAYKDLSLALKLGEETGVPLAFGGLVKLLMQTARASGYGQEDACALARVLEDVMGDDIRASAGG